MSYFPPGSTVGIVGGGQLGRMSAMAARELGYRVCVFDTARDIPAAGVCDELHVGEFTDLIAIEAFAAACDVVTFEFETIPFATLQAIEARLPVRPSPAVLRTTRHRILEKDFLTRAGATVARYAGFNSAAQLTALLDDFGQGIAKTCELGYDGKGQFRVQEGEPLPGGLLEMLKNGTEFVLEAVVDFRCEISVIVARNDAGETAVYQPFENEHRDHILDVTHWPARVSPDTAAAARGIALRIVEALDLVGLLCVELFVTPAGDVIVNELAPRPHNSGHITQDASVTSQFEQHIRAVVGLAPGSTAIQRPGAMANLLGDLWANGPPDFAGIMREEPELKLHLYGKKHARAGRKMGHLNLCGDNTAERLTQLRDRLR